MRLRTHETVFVRAVALARSAALIGAANSYRAVAYSLRRARLDARALPDPARLPERSRVPGRLHRAEEIAGGGRFHFTDASVDVRVLAGGGVFVGWDSAEPLPSYALEDLGADGGPAWHGESRLREAGETWTVSAGAFAVAVDSTGGLTFTSTTTDSEAGTTTEHVVRRDDPPRWDGDAWTHRSALEPDAAVLGLGGRSARVNRRPGSYQLWNTDPGGTFGVGDDPLSLTMPVYLVVADEGGHLAFYDDTFGGSIEIVDEVTARLDGGPLRYYVFPGAPAQALERYTALTGRPALPPRWALGLHQSRWGYGSQGAVHRMVEGYRQRSLPLSAVWLDIDHLLRRRIFTIDEERYPDIAGLVDEFAARDIHVVVIIDPGVPASPPSDLLESGIAADAFCRSADGDLARGVVWPGTTVYPDFTSPRARDWWSRLYAHYLDLGIEGFWHDMNEPSAFAAYGDPTLPLSTRHDLEGRGGDHREAHNVYGQLMNHAGRAGIRRLRPGRRPFMLSRSGWAGHQRYAGTWTGDIGTSWEGLQISLRFTLGLGASGVPYSGPDIGGFDLHPTPELYVRWFQLAAYLPFFRIHCSASLPFREPWEFGPVVLDQIRPALGERYRLLPYWYTLAWESHRTGAPYVRPLLWADPADRALRTVNDAFLVGDALLVAPVVEEAARERVVRLPWGRWYDRRTGKAYDGPASVTVPAGLDEVPVFARGGAVIPVDEDGEIVLEAYLPGPGSEPAGGTLVTDSGDGYDPPRDQRFTITADPEGAWTVCDEATSEPVSYAVRWFGGG